MFFCLNASAIIVTVIWTSSDILFTNSIHLITLITTSISIVVCIFCRFYYRKIILSTIEVSQKPIKKEIICSILLFISSFLRILFYIPEYFEWDYSKHVRNFKSDTDCIDLWPFNALIMLFIDLVINLLPAMIYSHLFTSKFKVSNYHKENKLLG